MAFGTCKFETAFAINKRKSKFNLNPNPDYNLKITLPYKHRLNLFA